jgi:hypothetical protein
MRRVHAVGVPVCPRCDGYIPNNETPGAYAGALSRVDNKTEVCSQCGTTEALNGSATIYMRFEGWKTPPNEFESDISEMLDAEQVR